MNIVRSFSRKINLGNFENCDFGCSMEDECEVDELEARSRLLHDYCKRDVEESIEEYKQELEDKKEVKDEPTKELKFDNVKLV